MPIIGVIASSMKGAPGIPTIGTATNVGTGRAYNNGAATVSFTPAAGATATSFTATSSPGGFTATGASSPLTVAGLQSSTSYTFTVTATNASGTSAASAASNSITATTVPQAPTIGTASDGGTGTTATVTYTANATGGAAVSAYTATSSPGSFTGTGTSPITVSGLTAGTAYTFTVTATNANGTSLASAASNSVTPAVPFAYNSISSYLTPTTPTAWGTLTTGGSFNSIPQTYRHLQFRISAQSSTSSMPDQWYFYINNDFSNRFSGQAIQGSGGNPQVAADSLNRTNKIESFPVGNTIANYRDTHILTYYNYSESSKIKIIRYEYFSYNNAGTYIRQKDVAWINTSTSAISSFQFGSATGDPVAGCTFSLYGIR
jgi:hypothetical protein